MGLWYIWEFFIKFSKHFSQKIVYILGIKSHNRYESQPNDRPNHRFKAFWIIVVKNCVLKRRLMSLSFGSKWKIRHIFWETTDRNKCGFLSARTSLSIHQCLYYFRLKCWVESKKCFLLLYKWISDPNWRDRCESGRGRQRLDRNSGIKWQNKNLLSFSWVWRPLLLPFPLPLFQHFSRFDSLDPIYLKAKDYKNLLFSVCFYFWFWSLLCVRFVCLSSELTLALSHNFGPLFASKPNLFDTFSEWQSVN